MSDVHDCPLATYTGAPCSAHDDFTARLDAALRACRTDDSASIQLPDMTAPQQCERAPAEPSDLDAIVSVWPKLPRRVRQALLRIAASHRR